MKAALMLGVNPKSKRDENDFYATNPKAMEAALPLFQEIGLDHYVPQQQAQSGGCKNELSQIYGT